MATSITRSRKGKGREVSEPGPAKTTSKTNRLSSDPSRQLNCLIEGDRNILIVTVSRDALVGTLKDVILSKAGSTFSGIGTRHLEALKVSGTHGSV
jgi:Crinkler effector protein N-terminal domain